MSNIYNMATHKIRLFFTAVCISIIPISLPGCGTNDKDFYQDKSAQEIYSLGKENSSKNNYLKAIQDFEALEARYPYGEYANKAQLALIHAYFERGEMEQSIAAADRFIKLHPSHPNVDYAYYIKAMANYNDNFSLAYRRLPLNRSSREPSQAKQAFDDFKILIDQFPNSKYTSDSKQRMLYLKNQLADHEWHVAYYYMKKHAYLAAANRAGYIVTNFDQTDSVPKALSIMVEAYKELDLLELSQEALNTLELNFPDSEEYIKTKKLIEKS